MVVPGAFVTSYAKALSEGLRRGLAGLRDQRQQAGIQDRVVVRNRACLRQVPVLDVLRRFARLQSDEPPEGLQLLECALSVGLEVAAVVRVAGRARFARI